MSGMASVPMVLAAGTSVRAGVQAKIKPDELANRWSDQGAWG